MIMETTAENPLRNAANQTAQLHEQFQGLQGSWKEMAKLCVGHDGTLFGDSILQKRRAFLSEKAGGLEKSLSGFDDTTLAKAAQSCGLIETAHDVLKYVRGEIAAIDRLLESGDQIVKSTQSAMRSIEELTKRAERIAQEDAWRAALHDRCQYGGTIAPYAM